MCSSCYETCNVSHINHKVSANFLGNFSESREIDDSGICRCTGHYKFWSACQSFLSYISHVNIALFVYIIKYHVVKLSAEVYR